MKYDVFISYRREGGYETAKHLNDLLVRDGYRVSFDIDTLREGDFDDSLLKRIEQCSDFMLVVDKHTFDRTLDPYFDPKKDWLRIELAYALKLKKNIIPLLLSGVDGFPCNLPEDVADVITKNGPEYNKYYFDEFYRRLKLFLHCVPHNAKDNNSVKINDMMKYFFAIIILISIIVLILFVSKRDVTPAVVRPIVIIENEQILIADNGMTIDVEDAVDLGLPSGTLWASKNIGATTPYKYGNYYAWGEVGSKEYYFKNNYLFNDSSLKTTLPKSIIHTQYDAATATLGKKWAMPTIDQKNELQKHCNWYWTSLNNISGFVVEGPNRKTIFLPAGGCYFANRGTGMLEDCSATCYYWTGEMCSSMQGRAAAMIMAEEYPIFDDRNGDFEDGKLIRPVYYEIK